MAQLTKEQQEHYEKLVAQEKAYKERSKRYLERTSAAKKMFIERAKAAKVPYPTEAEIDAYLAKK